MSLARQKLLDPFKVRGFVDWELINESTGKVSKRGQGQARFHYLPKWFTSLLPLGQENAIVNNARSQLASALIGTSVTYPQYIALGTGTTAVAAGDTGLETVSQYDGGNDAKIANSRTLKGLYTSRIVATFTTAEGNVNIRELGLFEGNDASQNMWARVRVTINKVNTERLNVYWYIIFERRTGLAIKTGASITVGGGATGAATATTFTFPSSVTVVMIHNEAGEDVYFKFNEALTGSPPTNYDLLLVNGERFFMNNEEIEVSTVSIYKASNITLPHNALSIRGW